MGNATHAPPNTSWGKKIPNVEFWFDLVKIITTKPRSSVARWCLGNGTLSPPSHWAQWRSWRIFPKIEQLRRGADGFFKKSSSSVGNWRSWRIFPKIEQLSRDGADGFFQKSSSSVVTELTDFSKNRAAQSWRSWRIFPKIERLQQNVENFPFSFNLVYFSGVYFFEKLALSTVFFLQKKLNNPALRPTTEGRGLHPSNLFTSKIQPKG